MSPPELCGTMTCRKSNKEKTFEQFADPDLNSFQRSSLCSTLLITTVFDRNINCRRAASVSSASPLIPAKLITFGFNGQSYTFCLSFFLLFQAAFQENVGRQVCDWSFDNLNTAITRNCPDVTRICRQIYMSGLNLPHCPKPLKKNDTSLWDWQTLWRLPKGFKTQFLSVLLRFYFEVILFSKNTNLLFLEGINSYEFIFLSQ